VSISLVRAGANEFIHRHRDAFAGRVLDAGCGHRPYRHLISEWHVGLDLDARVRPDVVGDVTHLPFATGSFDVVFACELLEHLPDPAASVREFARVLQPAGRLLLTVPFLYPPHGLPADFWRLSGVGLVRLLLPWFETEVVTAYGGRLAAVWSTLCFPTRAALHADNEVPEGAVVRKGRRDWRGRLLLTPAAEAFPLGYGVVATRLVDEVP
jgi:SAM-dependent methyltransferase